MALVKTYNTQSFFTSLKPGIASYFKYPYIYTMEKQTTTNILVKRHNVVTLTSESYTNIDLTKLFSSAVYYNYYSYNINTDKFYFCVTRSNHISLWTFDVETLEFKEEYVGSELYVSNDTITLAVCCFINDNGVTKCYCGYTYYLRSGNSDRIAYCVVNINTKTVIYKDSVAQSSGRIISFPTIVDNNNNFLKYGDKAFISYSYTTKVGFVKLSAPSTTNTYNSLQYREGLIIKFDNKYYVFGGFIGTEANSQIIEINPTDLTSSPVFDTNIKYKNVIAYPYNDKVYALYYDDSTSTEYLVTISLIDYNLTYNLASSNGETIFESVTEQSPITSLHFTNVVGETQVGYVFNTLSGVTSGVFDVEQVQNKTLVGFSTVPNSNTVQFPLNTSITVNIANDTTFYAVYGTYRPIATPFNINLYQKTCENNRVDKTNYITQVGTLSGVLREESSITDVTITFTSKDIPTFNYVYIEAFNRYYYVNDITSLKKDLWQMTLSVDVLMTYRNAILSCTGFVDRNENEFNADLIDKKRVVEEGNTIEVATVTNELFTATQGTYLLNGILVSTYNKGS